MVELGKPETIKPETLIAWPLSVIVCDALTLNRASMSVVSVDPIVASSREQRTMHQFTRNVDFAPPIFRRTRSDCGVSDCRVVETLPPLRGKVFRRGSLQNGVSRNTTVLSRDINRKLGLQVPTHCTHYVSRFICASVSHSHCYLLALTDLMQESGGKMLSRASSSVLAEVCSVVDLLDRVTSPYSATVGDCE